MKAIFGLGNPGSKYRNTRHNIGFMILDELAKKIKVEFSKSTNYHLGKYILNDEKCFLVKPSTYMNLSGEAVRKVIAYYKITLDNILVICDDINLPLGKIRYREFGGDGGHNGLSSIINILNTNNFSRLRIGIGNTFERGFQADYVLSEFSKEEKSQLDDTINESIIICEKFFLSSNKSVKDYISIKNIKLKKESENG